MTTLTAIAATGVAMSTSTSSAEGKDLRAAYPRLGSECRAKDHRQVPRPSSSWGLIHGALCGQGDRVAGVFDAVDTLMARRPRGAELLLGPARSGVRRSLRVSLRGSHLLVERVTCGICRRITGWGFVGDLRAMTAAQLKQLQALMGIPPRTPAMRDPSQWRRHYVTTHRFECGEAWNRHRRGGADGLRRSSTVTVRLFRGGSVRIEDAGKLRESHLDRQWGYKEERTEWDVAWDGTWRRAGDKLELQLQQHKRSCQRVEAWRGEKEKQLRCPTPTKRPQLTCTQADLPIGRGQQARAWRCLPASGTVQTGGTPMPWVFGLKRCLAVIQGGPLRYAPCSGGQAP